MALAPKNTKKVRRPLRALGAGAVSAALVGVFALPAYASNEGTIGSAAEAEAVYAQALSTDPLPEIAVPDELPTAEEKPVVVEVAAADGTGSSSGYADLPAGSGASGLAQAALAQVGWAQDCTDLAQNSLAAIGLTTSRADGGYDMGVSSFQNFGTVYGFNADALAPGDILVWPNDPHVAIYVGGGQVVHGGWGGMTVVAGLTNHGGYPSYVVRI